MTKNIFASGATYAIACTLASALTIGAMTAPALAAPQLSQDAEPVICAQASYMSEGEAVYIARTYLGIAVEDVDDLDVEIERWHNRICWKVELTTWGSDIEHHVIVDASNGTIHASWNDFA